MSDENDDREYEEQEEGPSQPSFMKDGFREILRHKSREILKEEGISEVLVAESEIAAAIVPEPEVVAAIEVTSDKTKVVDGDTIEAPIMPANYLKAKAVKNSKEITALDVETYLQALTRCGTYHRAAMLSGLSTHTMNRFRREDEEFSALCEEAMQGYVSLLHDAAHKRGVEGVLEPMYNPKTGQLMLKRHDPAFRDKFEGTLNVTGGVLIAPAMSSSAEQWEKDTKRLPDGGSGDIVEGEVEQK